MPLDLHHTELLREQNFIDQQWQAAKSGRLFSVSNPATGAVFAQVPDSGADDARAAVEGLMVSKFRNGGQTCMCPNRVFVQDGCTIPSSKNWLRALPRSGWDPRIRRIRRSAR